MTIYQGLSMPYARGSGNGGNIPIPYTGLFSVTAYGAKGDGVTDDTDAILAAIGAALPVAGAVIFEPGSYLISSPIVIGPLGGAYPVPAPSLINWTSCGHIGDNSYANEKSQVSLVASSSFPSGKFMVDYQMGTKTGDSGPTGARIQGIAFTNQGLGAGIRLQGSREFVVSDISIMNTALPSGYTENVSAAFNVTSPTNGTAGAWNHFQHITIMNTAVGQDGIWHDAVNQDVFFSCHVMNAQHYAYNLGPSCQATFIACDYEMGENNGNAGWSSLGALASIVGCSVESQGPYYGPGVLLQGQSNPAVNYQRLTFQACQFTNTPYNGATEQNAALIQATYTAGRPQAVLFQGCEFFASAYTSDYVYVAGSVTGEIEFDNCYFHQPVTNKAYNDTSGNNVLRFRNCRGINPTGPQIAPTVPASGTTLTNPFPVDCTAYVTGGTVSAISIGGTATGITSGPVTVPAGQTITLTYTAAPTWAWFGA